MKIPDIFRLNDWQNKTYFLTILIFLSLFDSLYIINRFLLEIPILLPIIGFFCLTFVPGFTILKILHIHNFKAIKNILLCVGLSLFCLISIGFFINVFLPLLGLLKPISSLPIFLTLNLVIISLLAVSYVQDRDYESQIEFFNIEMNYISLLFLFWLPFLSIFGVYLMNEYQNNTLILIVLFLLALIPFLIFLNISTKSYPLVIYITSITLLFHKSLIKYFIWGWDIQIEHYFANLVYSNSIWNSLIPNNINAMLSITILAPIYSILCNINLDWTFKLVYPLLFSFVPVALYSIFSSQLSEKVAFLSSYFFMLGAGYYEELLHLCRQQIAELFLVLFLLVLIIKERPSSKILALIFAIMVIVSHYGVSYLFLLLLVIYFIIKTFFSNNKEDTKISITFFILYLFFILIWYIYTTSGSSFITIVKIGDHIFNNLIEFGNPETSGMIDPIISATTFGRTITKILGLVSILFITIGLIVSLINKKIRDKFNSDFFYMAIAAFIICIIATIVPYFIAMHATRIFHFTLLFLAPFCITGAVIVIKSVHSDEKIGLGLIALFLSVQFLFSCGLFYTILGENSSIALDVNYDVPSVNHAELANMQWLQSYGGTNYPIYADYIGEVSLLRLFYDKNLEVFQSSTEYIDYGYIYLRFRNIKFNELKEEKWIKIHGESLVYPFFESSFFKSSVRISNKIYSNRESELYLKI